MRRTLLFGFIAAIVLPLLIIAAARTRYAQNVIAEFAFGSAPNGFPCEEWPSLEEWENLERETILAQDYVGRSGSATLVLDQDSARAAGISDETLALLAELFAFMDAAPNAMMDEEEERRLLNDFPKVKVLFECAEYRRRNRY